MPSYDYRCDKCGVQEYSHSMKEKMIACPTCGGKLERVYNFTSNVNPDMDYWDEHLGAYIHSREQRKQLMKQRGLADGAPDYSDRIIRQKKEHADKLQVSVPTLERMFENQRLSRPQRKEDVRH